MTPIQGAAAAVGAAGVGSSANAATEEVRNNYADPAEKGLSPSDREVRYALQLQS